VALLPSGGYPIAVKYIISYHIVPYHIISYHIISYHIIFDICYVIFNFTRVTKHV